MICKVVGIRHLDFITKEGTQIKGKKIQIVRKPSTREETQVDGSLVDTIFISDNSEVILPVFKFGQDYDFYYETDGKRSYLVSIKGL